eukprot:scaffold11926_cov67-Skeletonema_dohrnii-CCMP3373.AAC.1
MFGSIVFSLSAALVLILPRSTQAANQLTASCSIQLAPLSLSRRLEKSPQNEGKCRQVLSLPTSLDLDHMNIVVRAQFTLNQKYLRRDIRCRCNMHDQRSTQKRRRKGKMHPSIQVRPTSDTQTYPRTEDGVLKEVVDEASYQRLERLKNAAFVMKIPDYHHCPTPDLCGYTLGAGAGIAELCTQYFAEITQYLFSRDHEGKL